MTPSSMRRGALDCGRVVAVGVAMLLAAPAGHGQGAAEHGPGTPPFEVGEVLEYRVHVSVGGTVGRGQMRVEGPVDERGIRAWRLSFVMQAGRGPVKAVDRTTSWLDPVRFAATRFEKVERHPLSRSEERVEIDAGAGTWRDDEGAVHALGASAPLDELSFLYFLRTLPLDRTGSYEFARHFDEARNPTLVHVREEEVVETPAGTFRTRIVDMHVRDPKRYKGIGVIRVNIDLAPCRQPVRIRSRMPVLGMTTLTLEGTGAMDGAAPAGRCRA